MKILHITEAYGGGVFTSVNQLVEGQVAAGHSVTLAINPRAEAPNNWQEFIPDSVKVHLLKLRREINLVNDLKGLQQLMALIRQVQPDAIHLHSSKAGFLGRVAAFLTGYRAKTFYSPRAFAYLAPGLSSKKKSLYKVLEKVGALFGGTLVACSQDELNEAKNLGIKKAVLVNNAINIAKLDQIVADVQTKPKQGLTVLTTGRVCEAKRPELFVAVAEELHRRSLKANFVWVGGGGDFPQTELATCTGWVPRNQALRTLREQADIYLQTSSYEGMPLSVLEAQALGIPVVVADAIGNRSAVSEGYSGYVVNPVTVMGLADAVEKLLRSDSHRSVFGANARAWALAEFDTPLMLRRYEQLYQGGHV